MVLYHCCVSVDRAKHIVARGFGVDELVHVADRPPARDRLKGTRTYAVVCFGPPFGFSVQDHPAATNEHGEHGWLVPGAVLNTFPRTVWPQSSKEHEQAD